MTLTLDAKLELYRQGKYSFPPPPVYHGGWTEANWIDYIDAHGRWGTTYLTTKDQPYYNDACAALIHTEPMLESEVAHCRRKCAVLLKRIWKYGTRRQMKAFKYHMTWVNYPLRKRPNGKWS